MSRDTLKNLAKTVNWWTVAKAVGAALIPFALAFGFDFQTPGQRFKMQDAKIATNTARIDTLTHSVDGVRQEMSDNFSLNWRLACLDTGHYSKRDLRLAGLDCDVVMRRSITQAGTPAR